MSALHPLAAAIVQEARAIYGDGPIPLHRPVFVGNEKKYLAECIDSNFVSSVGQRVADFEHMVAEFVGAKHGIACVNGTAALHVALELVGVREGDIVLSQALTFIATCNAISYIGAQPRFVDVDRDTMGMSPQAVRRWLEGYAQRAGGGAIERASGRRIAACVPMHTFGHPCRIREIAVLCAEWGIPLVEDAAESLGSSVDGVHTGRFGRLGTLSFNGNKTITTGGGGMIVTDDAQVAARAKHLTTTAKRPHPFEFFHDETGYNYRLPNLNAALGCAQMELLPAMLASKARVTARWRALCARTGAQFAVAPAGTVSNYWLNAILVGSKEERDVVLRDTNAQGVMTRPAWRLMCDLPMFEGFGHDGLAESRWLEERLVNVPSSVPASDFGGLHP